METRKVAGNLDTGLLKMIAFVCMVADHLGAAILPQYIELRIIGRIAFPLYIWCLVVGASYTKYPGRYALRLLLGGLIAQPFYMLALNHGWDKGNIFFTLLLGYLGIWGMREKRCGSQVWAPLLVLLVPCFVSMDYGWQGVMLILLMYWTRESRAGIAAVMLAYCLFWGESSMNVTAVLGFALNRCMLLQLPPVKAFFRIQALAVLALPLILWPRSKRTPFPKPLAYAAYPGHLLILWLVKLALGLTTVAAAVARLTHI